MAEVLSNTPRSKMVATAWPLASHFSTMLQNPKVAFRDPQLRQLVIERDERNQPRAFAGSFANVYRGTFANGKGALAVRVFTSGSPERHDRYYAISEYVARRRLDSLVGFTYTDEGIRSTDGRWYPLVTMEWVAGQTLYKWVRQKALERSGGELARISELWVELTNELLLAQIAHGDLQQGNVMVTEAGRLKLVDYDCMCVPSLVGRRNLEVGVKPYQHPQRSEETLLSPALDNYSALVIFVALKALAAAPELWDTFVEATQYDKLLFREEDFQTPEQSSLIEALDRSPDQEVRQMTRELIELARVPLDKVPPLPHMLFSFSRVESLLNQREFNAAVEMVARGRRPASDAPEDLQARIRQAQERVQCLKNLEAAVAAGDEAAMQRWYLPRLLDDFPKAQPTVELAKQAPGVQKLLDELKQAEQAGQWRELVSIWDLNEPLLAHRKSAEPFLTDVRMWRARNRAWDTVAQIIEQPASDAAALDLAWTHLVSLGGHPESDSQRPQIEAIIRRHRAWLAFQKTPRKVSEVNDKRLIEAWNEALFAGWGPAEQERSRVAQARERAALLAQLKEQVDIEPSFPTELSLAKTAATLPDGYQYQLQPRMLLARQRVVAAEQFDRAMQEPASDVAIETAWNKLGTLNAQQFVAARVAPRIQLALRRAPVVKAVQEIPADYTIDQAEDLDAQILEAWQDALLAKCHDVDDWRATHQQAVARKKLLADLEQAIVNRDKPRIADLVAEPLLAGYPLPRRWLPAVKQAQADVEAARKLLAALEGNRRSKFLELFDTRIIRENLGTFEPHEEKLRQWMHSEILPAEKLGLAPPRGQEELVWEGEGARCRTRWNWPNPRFTDACVLAVCSEQPAAGDDLRKTPHHARQRIERRSYEEAGGGRVLNVEESWLGSYVAVAAIIDLGFEKFISEPLVLGRLDANRRGRRSGRRGGIAP